MGHAEKSSFAGRYFKLDYVQPRLQRALETGNAYFNDRPIFTTFSAIFFALSMLPVLAYLGIFLFTSVSFFLIALAVAFITSLAVFVSLSAILASILLGAFFASVFFTLVDVSGYLFLRLFALVQEDGVSGVAAWACEIKSHILNVHRHNSANDYRAQAQDNQSDTNDSVVVVHEPHSSDHNDESYHDVKVQAAD